MKLIIALVSALLLCGCVWAQPTPPSTPPSPEAMGIQAPQPTTGTQAPPAAESSQPLAPTTQASAMAAAPSTMAVAATSSMIVPPGTTTPNRFYIPYYPSTVASCYFAQWVPMWLDINGYGPLYSYEWYPNGKLVSQYLANVPYPSWLKMWFYGDAAGWHTLQYYCNGWSNYAYIYVYGQMNPTPPENPEKLECEQKPYCDWINGQCLCKAYNPKPDPAVECEKNPTCDWINGQCLCKGYNPEPDPAIKCEKNPTCNWVNGQCLCTGYNPAAQTHATGFNPAKQTHATEFTTTQTYATEFNPTTT